MMEVVEELNTLRLDVLVEEWVQGIYYSEFLEFGEFPPEYETILESLDIPSVFKSIMRTIDCWLNSEYDEEQSWAALSQHVEHQKLLALLAYYIDYGTKNIVTKEHRNNAILGARLYYKFLAIPGYKAYHIYHSQLFAHSLMCLGFPKKLCENEDNYFNSKELTKEVNSILKELRSFVLDLRAIADTLQLNPSDMNFEDIINNLVDVTGGAIVNKLSNVDKIEMNNICSAIYAIINIFINDSNGEPNAVVIRMIFKSILPGLVAACLDCRNATNFVRSSYVTYSGCLLGSYGKAALPGFTVLLEQLCLATEGLERGEVRNARAQLVTGMMSMLPRKQYRAMVKWLLTLSTTAKIPHRQIALEMLANLLMNEPEEEKPEEPQPEPPPTEQSGENTESPKEGEAQPPQDGEQAKEGENPEGQDPEGENPPPPPSEVPTEDESSQEADNPFPDDGSMGLLTSCAHTAPHKEILRAVYERVNDASSTMRTRALALLTDCLKSERAPMRRAIQELNGDGSVSRLMAVAARGVVDERAAVRRAAITLVHRSLSTRDAPQPTEHDLGILVGLCRDASIIVRTGAITALGELAVQRPTAEVFDAFLNGPMRQLSDPETKVQDQVVKLVQELVVDRLQKYIVGACEDLLPWMFLAAVTTAASGNKYIVGACEDLLPWMFLAAVTRHNMRRHLLKACGFLAKSSSCIR
ncbi:condensin-2 complex subunit D3 isoform X1 [Phthorimaea operculella]|nr:condensin-2 complex subunit D3 isoform X1 [Phthorimaea operculella]